jgi:CubicO group peptidase (beta-lactamase class C family)
VATLAGIAPEVDPGEVGLDADRLARLDEHLDSYVADGRQKGSLIAVTRGGKVAHVSARGYRDEEAGLPVEPDTIWRIYSMTKPITSVAAMILFEEGKLSLFDPVAKFIPSFAEPRVYRGGPAAAPITAPATQPLLVWHLLTHTSGLSYGFYFTGPIDELYRTNGFLLGLPEDYTLEEACDRWATFPLLFEPGSEWNYSHGTDVVGRIVEVLSGRPLDEFFAERILEPLGMTETRFALADGDEERLTALYMFDPETGKAVDASVQNLIAPGRPRFFAGGHGLISTAADYHRFTQMLLNRGDLDGVRVLAPRTVDLMAANHLPGNATMDEYGRPLGALVSNVGRGFGLGLAPLVDPIAAKSLSSKGEYHWGGAAGTHFWVDPSEELTVLFFTQVLFAPDELWLTMRRLVYQALLA